LALYNGLGLPLFLWFPLWFLD